MGGDKRDKTTGLPLPTPVTPATTICFTMQIPNAPQYIRALRGVVAELGKGYTWQQTVGQDNAGAFEAAEIWRLAATTITYSDDCEGGVSCIDVANCIETDASVQAAIDGRVTSSQVARDTRATLTQTGSLTDAQLAENLLLSSTCTNGELFSQITELIGLLNDLSEDIFQSIEAGTSAIERASLAFAAIPALETLPVNEVLDFVDLIASDFETGYLAAYNQSLFDELRCELFCIKKDTCVLTIDDVFDFYLDKLDTELPNDPVSAFTSGVEFFITGSFASNAPVYAMHLLSILLIRMAQNAFGINFARLALRLKGVGDIPNDDYAFLCVDCLPQGDWEISTRFANLNLGTIAAQTSNSVTFQGAANGDGIYRLDFIRPVGCVTILTVSYPPASDFRSAGCGQNAEGVFIETGLLMDRGGVAKFEPFSLSFTW